MGAYRAPLLSCLDPGPTPTTVRGKCDTYLRRSGGGRSPGLGTHGALRFCLDPGLRRDDNVVESRPIQRARFFAMM